MLRQTLQVCSGLHRVHCTVSLKAERRSARLRFPHSAEYKGEDCEEELLVDPKDCQQSCKALRELKSHTTTQISSNLEEKSIGPILKTIKFTSKQNLNKTEKRSQYR